MGQKAIMCSPGVTRGMDGLTGPTPIPGWRGGDANAAYLDKTLRRFGIMPDANGDPKYFRSVTEISEEIYEAHLQRWFVPLVKDAGAEAEVKPA